MAFAILHFNGNGVFNPPSPAAIKQIQAQKHHLTIKDQKIKANYFRTDFFENPLGHGRSRRKVCFPVAPEVGRNSLTLRQPGVRVWSDVRGKIQPKKLKLMLFFSSPNGARTMRSGVYATVHARSLRFILALGVTASIPCLKITAAPTSGTGNSLRLSITTAITSSDCPCLSEVCSHLGNNEMTMFALIENSWL